MNKLGFLLGWAGLLVGISASVSLRKPILEQSPAARLQSPLSSALADSVPTHFGFGRPATTQEIAALDIDVRPDGTGLPTGSGTVATGRTIYAAKCASCHGKTGVEGPYQPLVTVPGTPPGAKEAKTIGNYWPYATTVFDYIRRAMPFTEPGSLTNEEVYHLTAFLLAANGLIDEKTVIDAKSLPKVVMPALKRYVPDDRKGGAEVK